MTTTTTTTRTLVALILVYGVDGVHDALEIPLRARVLPRRHRGEDNLMHVLAVADVFAQRALHYVHQHVARLFGGREVGDHLRGYVGQLIRVRL